MRKRATKVSNPLDFNHEADANFVRDTHDLPGGDILLTTEDVAKRQGRTVDAIRKERARGGGPVTWSNTWCAPVTY
jgi:hypothetical protein